MPRAGDYRHVLLYQEPVDSFDRTHQPVPTAWTTVATWRGLVRSPNGREARVAQAQQSLLTHVVETRYPGFAPKTSGRLVWQTCPAGSTGVLAITWAGDPDGRRRELHAWCAEHTDTADTGPSNL